MVSRSRHFVVAALAALVLPSGLTAVEAAASPADLRADMQAAANVDLVVGNATVSEAAATNLKFTIRLSQAPTSTVYVFYETVERTATAGADYRTTAGWLSFGTTQRARTVRVPVLDDSAGEATERMTLKVSRITGPVTIADGTGVGAIKDAADLNHFVVKVNDGVPDAVINFAHVLLEPGGQMCTADTPCDLGLPDGTAITLTAVEDVRPGNATFFQNWSGNACTMEGKTCSLVVRADVDTTAVFEYVASRSFRDQRGR